MSTDETKHLTLLGQSGVKPPDSPDDAVIETFANTHPDRSYTITFHCPEFTAVCPITGQPDFGTITVSYIPAKSCIESKALKLYLHSFRNQGIFHENVVNRILDDLVKAVSPRQMTVLGEFNARGGISIEVMAEHSET
jgi:7-cyano-7-deazaguanine reductase